MPRTSDTDPRRLTLNIPRLWERDWDAVINGAAGADKLLLTAEGRAAHLLKSVSDVAVTFERLAWLSLWTKTFSILEGARAAVVQHSQYLLELLSRTSFELVLDLITIAEAEPVERLRAYAAWCLWNDCYFQKEFADGSTLRGIWNAQPAADIKSDPAARAVYEQLFGSLDIETDTETLRKGRFRQQHEEQLTLERLKAWLAHPDLRRWNEQLHSLTGGNARRQVAFFALFNESHRNVVQRLNSLEMRFLYLSYVKGSMFVHGSTLEHVFLMDEKTFTPLVAGHPESVESQADLVCSTCNTVLVLLHSTQRKLWPQVTGNAPS